MSRTVLLSYIYGPRNAGDMALNLGAIDILNRLGRFRIVGLSRFGAGSDQYARTRAYLGGKYPNVVLAPYPISYDRWTQGRVGRLGALVRGGAMLAWTLFGGRGGAGDLADRLDRADMLLFNGGNLLFARGARDLVRLSGILYPVFLARRMGKRYGFLPQSIPHLDSPIGRRIVNSVLAGADFVHFREGLSARKVSVGGAAGTRDVLDLAFYIEAVDLDGAAALMREHGLADGRFVPVIVRVTTLGDRGTLDPAKVRRAVSNVRDLCAGISERGQRACFVVQTSTDMDVSIRCRRVAAEAGVKTALIEEYDPLILRGLYSRAKAVVTQRLHAAIFALSVGTRTFGLFRSIWGQKMPGTFAALGIPGMCRCIDDGAGFAESIETGAADSEDRRFRSDVLAAIDESRHNYVAMLREHMGL